MLPKRIALLAAGALFCATAAFAQTTGSGATGSDTGTGQPGYTRHDPGQWMKSMCIEHFARSASRLAYLEARLQLTSDQQPLWDKYQQVSQSGAAKERDDCLASVPAAGTKPTALDREDRMEKMMAGKLASMQASRPALEALYNALSPEQRIALDRPMHRHHGDFRHHHRPDAQPQPL